MAFSLEKSLRDARDILVDVRANGPAATTDSRIGKLISSARELGSATFWNNDVFESVSKKGGWKLNILAQDAFLCGFVVYKFSPESSKLEVQYIAIEPAMRGQGCGTRLIKWLQNYAQQTLTRSQVSVVVCACVPESVGFYQKLGFKRIKEIQASTEEEKSTLIPGQMLMQWKVAPTKK
jgi:ribosomal protein S18 acetylase RimI-like enzyme